MADNKDAWNQLWLGIVIPVFFYLLSFILLTSGRFWLIFIAPVLHIAAIIAAFAFGKIRLGQGLLIALGLVILLVAACFGLIFSMNN